jgi:hypothetical protein
LNFVGRALLEKESQNNSNCFLGDASFNASIGDETVEKFVHGPCTPSTAPHSLADWLNHYHRDGGTQWVCGHVWRRDRLSADSFCDALREGHNADVVRMQEHADGAAFARYAAISFEAAYWNNVCGMIDAR